MTTEKLPDEALSAALAAALHDYMYARQTLTPEFTEVLARQIAIAMRPVMEDVVTAMFNNIDRGMQHRYGMEMEMRQRQQQAMVRPSLKPWRTE